MAEAGYRGLVIGNDAPNFSAGANLALVYMQALEQEFDEVNMMIPQFQNAMMRMRYSSIPVVGAPHGLALGGGCEICLHGDRVVAAAETYMGLVEFGVGLIPAGGGTKEMMLRTAAQVRGRRAGAEPAAQHLHDHQHRQSVDFGRRGVGPGLPAPRRRNRGQQQPRHCRKPKPLRWSWPTPATPSPCRKPTSRCTAEARWRCSKPACTPCKEGRYISDARPENCRKLAYVMCGGDLSAPTEVSEQYLLDLEREAFLVLCGERKTLERIQSILTTGKPLRN